MTDKSISSSVKLTLSGLFFFSLPNIFGSLLEPVTGIVDTALIGNKDTTWLAALSLGVVILSSFTWVFNFLIHTSIQSVSEAYSISDSDQIHSRVKVALLLSLFVGLFSSVFLYFFSSPVFDFVGAKG
ncbi:MATE family efflux transporter, partial [Halobacteriovorax sp.]|uniref:MATE family efflux transporter n=1 Tax=Halobacteriovorax sp. TaxID=2020862 RepID=UPI003569A216